MCFGASFPPTAAAGPRSAWPAAPPSIPPSTPAFSPSLGHTRLLSQGLCSGPFYVRKPRCCHPSSQNHSPAPMGTAAPKSSLENPGRPRDPMTYLPVSFLRPASQLAQPPAAPGLCVPCPVQGCRPHSVIVGGVSGPGVQSPRAEGYPKQRSHHGRSWVQPRGTRLAGKPRPLTPAVPGHLYCDPEPRKSLAPQAPDLATV